MSKFTACSPRYPKLLLLAAMMAAAGAASGASVDARDSDASLAQRANSAPAYAVLSAPRYPLHAWLAAQEGQVTLAVELDVDGQPSAVRVHAANASRELVQAAIASVRQWRFEPARREGVAVTATVLVPVEFSMSAPSRPAQARRGDADAARRFAKS